MTRVLLIQAGPTPWDLEDRLVGNQALPLTELGRATVESIARSMTYPASVIYRSKANEACDQAARIVANVFQLRPRINEALNEWNLGLWQGLTRNELTFRYPSVLAEWEENPLAVNPPDGEPLPEAIDRLNGAMRAILRRNRGVAVVLPLRPLAMQICQGLLQRQDPLTIARHLHNTSAVETIDLSNDDLHQFIA